MSEAEEKAYFVECIQNVFSKRYADHMEDLESLQKKYAFKTPASSFDLKKAFPGK